MLDGSAVQPSSMLSEADPALSGAARRFRTTIRALSPPVSAPRSVTLPPNPSYVESSSDTIFAIVSGIAMRWGHLGRHAPHSAQAPALLTSRAYAAWALAVRPYILNSLYTRKFSGMSTPNAHGRQ